MTSRLTIVRTGDGSNTIRDNLLDVTYHSLHGAVTESDHVFIQQGLAHVSRRIDSIHILEMGYGTGLNAYLSYLYSSRHDLTIEYDAYETHFLPQDIYSSLDYGIYVNDGSPGMYEAVFANVPCALKQVDPGFTLSVHDRTIFDLDADRTIDLVYYDAFGPTSDQALWDVPVLQKVYQSMKQDGVLVTFCAQGQFKRNLRSLGMQVESLPGPPGKREMVRATKI